MTALKEASSFVFVTLLVTALSGIQKETKIKIGSFEITKEYAGVVLFATLCALVFHFFKLFNNLASLRSQLPVSRIEEADFIIRANPWIFNPFSETDTPLNFLSDNLGFGLLLTIWWLGFHTGLFYSERSGRIWVLVGRLLAMVYLTFGLITMIIISQLISEINTQFLFKHILMLVFVPVGALGIRRAYIRKQREDSDEPTLGN